MYPSKTYTIDEALKRIERYCIYQERCHKEVTQKLIEMKMIPEARDHIIVHLIRHDFLNEERFAKTFVRGKFRMKKWGKQRLHRALKQKGMNTTIILSALNDIDDEDYLQTFNELAEKKTLLIKEQSRLKKRKKLADFLLYRGWENHLVYDKIRELIP